MIYLTISIIFMASMALTFRAAADKGVPSMGLNAVFRIVAGAISLVALIATGGPAAPLEPGLVMPMILGALFYWLSGLAAIQAVRTGHLGMTWTVTRCSTALPTVVSLLWWREIEAMTSAALAWAVVGLCAIFGAIVMLGIDRVRQGPGDPRPVTWTWTLWLAMAFLCQGSWEVTLRAAGEFDDHASKLLFMQGVFIGSGLLSVASVVAMRLRLGRNEWFYGAVASMGALIGSGLRPWAINDLGGVIVFPITAVAVLLIVQLASSLIWGEPLGRWGYAGLAAAMLGVALVSV